MSLKYAKRLLQIASDEGIIPALEFDIRNTFMKSDPSSQYTREEEILNLEQKNATEYGFVINELRQEIRRMILAELALPPTIGVKKTQPAFCVSEPYIIPKIDPDLEEFILNLDKPSGTEQYVGVGAGGGGAGGCAGGHGGAVRL